jgi:sterol desaturase/sphingolipid hydroxylase (fatty acid hydroxylase superfamily)
MDQFVTFFESLGSKEKFIWIVICLSFNWILEFAFPMVRFEYKKWKHALVNLCFLLMTMVIHSLFALITVGVFEWLARSQFGLLHLGAMPNWVKLVLSVMALDFVAQYLVHYCLHHVRWMWRFHMIHHSDSKVDATTATRHHPGDYLMREIFALAIVVVMGIPVAFYIFYKIATVFFGYLTHSNIRLPLTLDRIVGLVFITPNIHKFHHHIELPWTDSNFGNVFSFWDRIFGTLTQGDPNDVVFGLDIVPAEEDQNILYQLKIPFNKSIQSKTKEEKAEMAETAK